jgi:hypothetical protein
MRPADASRHASASEACGRGARFRRADAEWAQRCGSTMSGASAGWEWDGAYGMRCGHGVRELRPDAGLGPDVHALALVQKTKIFQCLL